MGMFLIIRTLMATRRFEWITVQCTEMTENASTQRRDKTVPVGMYTTNFDGVVKLKYPLGTPSTSNTPRILELTVSGSGPSITMSMNIHRTDVQHCYMHITRSHTR